ncbi:MAG: tetratricopeptide repeat protein, partial [Rhodoferax sp.]
GDSESRCDLARLMLAQDPNENQKMLATFEFLKSAQGGNGAAWGELAVLFKADVAALARVTLRNAAEAGHVQSQFELAQMYSTGQGVAKSASVAFHWYRLAAEQGSVDAQAALGACFLAGDGCELDYQLASLWLEKAAEQGNARAQWNLGTLFSLDRGENKRDLRVAFLWFKKAAASGFVPAQATLGVMFARIQDFEQAHHWLETAAGQGDPEAAYNLALAYIKGQGTSKDLSRAFHWMALAAERGVPQAQARLGLMYATGDGVALDAIEAHKWLALAAGAGDASAKLNFAHSEAQLGLMQLAEARRRLAAWLEVSARKQSKLIS